MKAPLSSCNPDLTKLIKGKRHVIVFNKADLTDGDLQQVTTDRLQGLKNRKLWIDLRKRTRSQFLHVPIAKELLNS